MRLILKLAALLALPTIVVHADGDVNAARIYQQSCSVCHGDGGRGARWGRESLSVPPRDFTSASARRELTRERMLSAVTAGRPGTPMPGFATQLDSTEIAAVVDYVRETFMHETGTVPDASAASQAARLRVPETVYSPVAPDERQQPLPAGLMGDPVRGRALYLANCTDCHGANGQGDGPRAYFIFPKPRNFHDPATRAYLNRPNLYRGIKHGVVGREMPAWGKVIGDQQIADITEFVYREFVNE